VRLFAKAQKVRSVDGKMQEVREKLETRVQTLLFGNNMLPAFG